MPVAAYRLYVSHSLDNLIEQDLQERFTTFGKSVVVDRFHYRNAVGSIDRYCFVSLQAEEKSIQRCLAVLNNSHWKGAKIKVQLAKPDFRERMSNKNGDAITKKPKKSKEKLHDTDGKETSAKDTPVDLENMKGKKAWRKSKDEKHPIFPIGDRPLYPLPPAEGPQTSATSEAAGDAVPQKKRKNKEVVSTKAKRQKIDSTRWNSMHLSGEEAFPSMPVEQNTQNTSNVSKTGADRPPLSESPSSAEDDDSDDLDAEAIKTLDASLDPEALRVEKAAQLSILQGILSKQAQQPPKLVTVASDGEEVQVAGDGISENVARNQEDAETAQPTGKRKRLIDTIKIPAEADRPTSTSYKPVPRYNPEEEEQDLNAEETNMDSLKEMFKPKEAEGGFKLGDLLDDLELEYEPFQEVDIQSPTFDQLDAPLQPYAITSGLSNQTASQSKLNDKNAALFFPLCFDNPEDTLLASLHLSQQQKARLEARSWTAAQGLRVGIATETDDRAEVVARHTEQRSKLTEQVKKRHREALRKHSKRKTIL